ATFIGYKLQEQEVAIVEDEVVTVNFEMALEERTLDVVVVTGYQTLSKERATGSYVKPDVEILQNRTSSMNILEDLDGLVPGLVTNNMPGSEPLLIRGLTSINANRQPLYVVDGMPMEHISSITPRDVEDITVLKDATA